MNAETTAPTARPLKIALVTELRGRGDEAMRIWLRQFERAMAAAGHEVQRQVLDGPARYGAVDPRNLRRVAATEADVIQYVPYSGLTTAALIRMRVLGLALPRALRSIAVLQAGRDNLKPPPGARADVALFASRRLADRAGAIAERGAVVYPVVEPRFSPGDVDRDAVLARLGAAPGRPVILHVGHLKASRNLSVLADLARDGRFTVVMVASTSTEPDAAVRAELEGAGVTVVREFLSDIELIYRAADLYVFPVQDTLGSIEVPLSVVEARSCGVPALTTRFGALPELFADGGLITYAEPETFVSRAASLLSEPGPRTDDRRGELDVFAATEFVRRIEDAITAPTRRAGASSGAHMIVLSGVDGAGKSTQIQRLVSELTHDGLRVQTLWCRWDPLIAKPAVNTLGWLSRRRSTRNAASHTAGGGAAPSTTIPQKRRAIRARLLSNRAFAAVWRTMMVIDYGLRLAPRVRRARRSNDVVLLDRYWHDVMVDYSFGRPLQEPPRALRALLPEPDGMVILDVPEEVALTRKTDTPDRAYLSDRRRLYGEVARRYNGEVVDASGSADAVFAAVREHVRAIADPS